MNFTWTSSPPPLFSHVIAILCHNLIDQSSLTNASSSMVCNIWSFHWANWGTKNFMIAQGTYLIGWKYVTIKSEAQHKHQSVSLHVARHVERLWCILFSKMVVGKDNNTLWIIYEFLTSQLCIYTWQWGMGRLIQSWTIN